MHPEYSVINLNILIQRMSLERVNEFLSTFSCPKNKDIENFLKDRAVEFSNKGIARTHLVLKGEESNMIILGYYTLANKILPISNEDLSNTEKKKYERFGILDDNTNIYNIPMPLIASPLGSSTETP